MLTYVPCCLASVHHLPLCHRWDRYVEQERIARERAKQGSAHASYYTHTHARTLGTNWCNFPVSTPHVAAQLKRHSRTGKATTTTQTTMPVMMERTTTTTSFTTLICPKTARDSPRCPKVRPLLCRCQARQLSLLSLGRDGSKAVWSRECVSVGSQDLSCRTLLETHNAHTSGM